MKWFENTGKEKDVVVSTRVRLARNLKGYPFEPKLTEAGAHEIIDKLKGVYTPEKGYKFTDFDKLGEVERAAYSESHLVSAEFAAKKTPCALFEATDGETYVMVCEEDHVRIQSILPGLALKEAYQKAAEADDLLDDGCEVAYSEKLGYLTHCPTNLGTGMRLSVMMFLPMMTSAGQMRGLENQLGKMGLTIRGMAGEGSAADGCLYQISNQVTLGITEEETIDKLTRIIDQLIDKERKLRSSLSGAALDRVTDRVNRSCGTMRYATMMDTAEMLSLYADVRLGAAMGMLGDLTVDSVDKLIVSAMPAALMAAEGHNLSSAERDKKRAELIKKTIG